MLPTALVPRQRNPRQVASVRRAIEFLRLVAGTDPESGLSVTTAAERLGVDKSTVSRLMSTLAAGGLIIVDEETRHSRIGAASFVLGSHFWGASLAQTLRPALRQLSQRADCTAQVGTLQDDQVLYLAVVEGNARLRVVAAPGDQRPAHASAMGKVLLAKLTEDRRDEIIRSLLADSDLLPEQGPGTIRSVAAFRRELDVVARRGYSTSDEESTADVAAIAVPLTNVPHTPLALSVTFPAHYATSAQRLVMLQHLRTAAKTIERRFALGPIAEANLVQEIEEGAAGS